MSIKFRYRTTWDKLQACLVYSDVAIEELREWGRSRRLPADWLRQPREGIPHYRLYGSNKALCGPGVSGEELQADKERWRRWRNKGKTAAPSQET